jgi:hypothetical protein
MTSFAFILGVVPLVIASGAGASARKELNNHFAVRMRADAAPAGGVKDHRIGENAAGK